MHRRSISGSSKSLPNGLLQGGAGLGLSVNGSAATATATVSGMSKRVAYPVVSTPSVFGDEEAAAANGLSSPETSFHDAIGAGGDTSTSSYAIREHEYDDGPSGSSSTMAFRRSIDAVARGSGSPYSTPLLGSDSKFSRRNSNDYSPGYGGRHVLPGSPTTSTTLANGGHAGKKPLLLNANLSNASVVNMSPVSTPTFGASMASMQAGAGVGAGASNPYLGWKSYITGKRRIHPLALGPAFLLGVLLAMSGLFGQKEDSSLTSRCVSFIKSGFYRTESSHTSANSVSRSP